MDVNGVPFSEEMAKYVISANIDVEALIHGLHNDALKSYGTMKQSFSHCRRSQRS